MNSFKSLRNAELSAVAFVADYVEFHFNGPRIRALTNPKVIKGHTTVQFPSAGSRDSLCSLIGHTVANATLKDKESLSVHFKSGAELVIPLDDASYRGPEAMHWHEDDNAPVAIW